MTEVIGQEIYILESHDERGQEEGLQRGGIWAGVKLLVSGAVSFSCM